MKLTVQGVDYITIDETVIYNQPKNKVHIIRLDFVEPTIEKMNNVLTNNPTTNRFVVSSNIRFYNSYLKTTNKKYYVMNVKGDKLISFYRKNNKVLLDTTCLTEFEKLFVLNVALEDILLNTEVLIISKEDFKYYSNCFDDWIGNLIIL